MVRHLPPRFEEIWRLLLFMFESDGLHANDDDSINAMQSCLKSRNASTTQSSRLGLLRIQLFQRRIVNAQTSTGSSRVLPCRNDSEAC